MTSFIGHNQPTFDDVVQENLERGLLLGIKNTILTAIDDPRLDRRHLRVLALVINHLNTNTGTAYPGRKRLANETATYERPAYTEGTVAVTIADLVSWGYLVSTKRAPEGGGRALSHYTIARPTVEDLQAQITAWVRQNAPAPGSVAKGKPWADVNNGVNVSGPEVKIGLNVNPVLNVKPVVLADVNPVLSTVTSKDLTSRKGSGSELPSVGATFNPDFLAFWKAFPGGRKQGKGATEDLFLKIVSGKHPKRHATAAELIDGAKRYAATKPDPEYTPLPATWLNGARWLDDIEEAEPEPWWKNPTLVAAMDDERWENGIRKHASERWDTAALGPSPAKPDCRVPKHLIAKLRLNDVFDHRGLRRK